MRVCILGEQAHTVEGEACIVFWTSSVIPKTWSHALCLTVMAVAMVCATESAVSNVAWREVLETTLPSSRSALNSL